ncbi:MAG: hypothetical protein K0S63_885 [Gammaproteobacteria bacterium]|nr:hypothetical protein [Gammaproteobacteria bacterium]
MMRLLFFHQACQIRKNSLNFDQAIANKDL